MKITQEISITTLPDSAKKLIDCITCGLYSCAEVGTLNGFGTIKQWCCNCYPGNQQTLNPWRCSSCLARFKNAFYNVAEGGSLP